MLMLLLLLLLLLYSPSPTSSNDRYMRVIKRAIKHVTHEYSGVEFERQAVCPQCLVSS